MAKTAYPHHIAALLEKQVDIKQVIADIFRISFSIWPVISVR